MSDRSEPRWDEMAGGYHAPPPTPREEMWTAIRARLDGGTAGVPLRRARGAPRRALAWLGVSAAAAAMGAVGFGLGRFGGTPVGPAAEVPAVPSPGPGSSLRAATAEHLARSEELLTLVRTDARAGRVDRAAGVWGRGLLVQTRLLLDSPAGDDPQLRTLLEDLELILAQVALLAGEEVGEGRAREELRLIAEGLDHQHVLPRIQAALPATSGS